MTTDIIIPFKNDEFDLENATSLYDVRIVCKYDDWPEDFGAIWQIEGDEEDLDKFVEDWNRAIALC